MDERELMMGLGLLLREELVARRGGVLLHQALRMRGAGLPGKQVMVRSRRGGGLEVMRGAGAGRKQEMVARGCGLVIQKQMVSGRGAVAQQQVVMRGAGGIREEE